MQWFINIIEELMEKWGYATQSWVLNQLCTSSCRVYRNTYQSIPSAVWTKIQFNAESWDVNNEFSASKFTAKKAGYFQVNLAAMMSTMSQSDRVNVAIYKNGGAHSITWEHTGWSGYNGSYLSDMVCLNGTTDYIEAYVYQSQGTARNLYGHSAYTFMSIHQLSKAA